MQNIMIIEHFAVMIKNYTRQSAYKLFNIIQNCEVLYNCHQYIFLTEIK